jgi:hypothetical protein
LGKVKQQMPKQEEHEKPENLVESPHEAEHAARSLEDAADSNATLEGYYAINETEPPEEVGEEADKEREKKKPG